MSRDDKEDNQDYLVRELKAILPKRLNHSLHFSRLIPGSDRRVPFDHKDLRTDVERHGTKGFLSYSLFNADLDQKEKDIAHIYIMGLLQNAALAPVLYPGWKTLFYLDATSLAVYPSFYKPYLDLILKHWGKTSYLVAVDFRTHLPPRYETPLEPYKAKAKNGKGWDLAMIAKEMGLRGNLPLQYPKTIWRFIPAAYPVAFCSRDADARLSAREAVAMDAWLHSTYTVHRIFDNVGHTNPFLAGLWGAKPVCHSLVSSFDLGPCKTAKEGPLPKLVDRMLEFLGDRDILLKGYGVDELMMGEVDTLMEKTNYTKVATYGQGAYYAGASGIATFLEGRPRLKLGMDLLTLLPCDTPDNWQGSHQSLRAFQRGKMRGSLFGPSSLFGTGCYFVGEDLGLSSSIKPGIVEWLREATLHYAKARPSDLEPPRLATTLKRHGIVLKAKPFSTHLKTMDLSSFKDKYHFDKRILPHFWYTLTKGAMGDIAFFDGEGIFNTNDYELTVFEKAMRTSFLSHKEMWPKLLTDIGFEFYDEKVEDLAEWLACRNTRRSRPFRFRSTNYAHFYRKVASEVEAHSSILSKLNLDQKVEYWAAMISLYPFTALRKWSFDF